MGRYNQRGSLSNGNETGNSYDRAARRRWLLSPEAGFGGDGKTVPCAFGCGTMLVDDKTQPNHITVDRYPIPKREGGRYVRGNIRPACATDNYGETRRASNGTTD